MKYVEFMCFVYFKDAFVFQHVIYRVLHGVMKFPRRKNRIYERGNYSQIMENKCCQMK